MINIESRSQIVKKLGHAVDSLVKELYSAKIGGVSARQEPEITSRLCQRLEDKLDKTIAGEYVFRVIAQSLPDRGPNSMEKLIGADLFLSVSLEGQEGFDKGVFIQAKYDRNINHNELKTACQNMKREAGNEGAYVWIYQPEGVKVVSSHQVNQMQHNSLADVRPRSVEGFFGRILDCYAGSKKWGVPSRGDRRIAIDAKLLGVRTRNLLDIQLKKLKS